MRSCGSWWRVFVARPASVPLMPTTDQGRQMGHEFIGVVEDVGSGVSGLQSGDFVISPFLWEDNTCDFCREGLQTSCRHGGRYGFNGVDGGQGEAVRVPEAEGTLLKLPVGQDSALLASMLTLTDVLCTGHHCVVKADVMPGDTVAVIGDERSGGRGARRPSARCRANHFDGRPRGSDGAGPRVRSNGRDRRAGRRWCRTGS